MAVSLEAELPCFSVCTRMSVLSVSACCCVVAPLSHLLLHVPCLALLPTKACCVAKAQHSMEKTL